MSRSRLNRRAFLERQMFFISFAAMLWILVDEMVWWNACLTVGMDWDGAVRPLYPGGTRFGEELICRIASHSPPLWLAWPCFGVTLIMAWRGRLLVVPLCAWGYLAVIFLILMAEAAQTPSSFGLAFAYSISPWIAAMAWALVLGWALFFSQWVLSRLSGRRRDLGPQRGA